LQIHEKLSIGLAVYEILGYYVVGFICETLVRDCLDFKGEVESTQVLERDRRHTYLILFCWDFNYRSVLIRLIEILNADYLRNFTFCEDG